MEINFKHETDGKNLNFYFFYINTNSEFGVLKVYSRFQILLELCSQLDNVDYPLEQKNKVFYAEFKQNKINYYHIC